MSKESGGNEIDDIFKNAIERVNTEPSEGFWKNAAEDVISRSGKLNQKKTSRWRAIAFILGASLLTLGYFSYKMETRLNTVEKQVRTIENIEISDVQKENANSVENVTLNKAASSTNTTPQKTDISRQSIASTNSATNQRVKYPAQTGLTNNNRPLKIGTNKTKTSTAVVFDIQSHKQYKKPANFITYKANDKVASSTGENSVDNSIKPENTTNTLASNEGIAAAQKSTMVNPESTPQSFASVSGKVLVPAHDTSKTIQLSTDGTNPSRFSISAFFSPDFMVGYKYKTTDFWGSQMESAIKTSEKQNFSYTAGIKGEYDFLSRFAISVGLTYQVFSFNTTPGIIYARKQSGGDVGYYLATSSGVVECPSYYGTPSVGDSIKMNASSTRTYLEIPVQLKYNFIDGGRIKLYFNVGAEANICVAEKTTMNWQDFWNESGVANVNNVEGSKTLYMSYYIGIGANYKMGKYFSLYLEPGLHEAITGLDNNTSPVITYPQLFSVTAGLTYHIK